MSTLYFCSGLSLGFIIAMVAILVGSTRRMSNSEYNKQTIQLMEERNKLDEQKAYYLEKLVAVTEKIYNTLPE